MMEARAPWEICALFTSMPLIQKSPKGEGQPVLVIPAFMTTDRATNVLRRFLQKQGFDSLPWLLGRNSGLRHDLFNQLCERIRELYRERGEAISLVGWSLGGVYARALAHKLPDHIRQVITLGSPFRVSTDEEIAAPVRELYRRLNPGSEQDLLFNGEPYWQQPLPSPNTSIYSTSDGIARWQDCVDENYQHSENICIPGSHMGMTHNPCSFYLIAERLAQPEGDWKPFNSRLPKWLFNNTPPN
jgi:pimeloyl-ACP methyl ester carboxylesterase